ncbi:MAG: deoxyribonuclease IV [Elusimicrobiota bacterium]
MIIGVHASIARGYAYALAEVRALGCRALQILPYPRRHSPSEEELSAFRAERSLLGLQALLIHSRFVPSLASSDGERRERSVRHLCRELRLAEGLGGDAFVLHAGAYSPGSREAEGVRLFADSVRRAVRESDWKGPLLLENVPGGGRRMGGTFEELARLQDALGPEVRELGVCLDTAHAWAAGYDLSSAEGALKFLARAHRLLGGDSVRAFHINDTRAPLSSHLENHAHLGKGRLGLEGLKALLDRSEFADTPGILETPKEGLEADRENLAVARRLSSASN